ncbi:11789_t:CDS:2 [Entrophospora sp. SA101]|nr:11789_t:CDS:2 [Entrophospora sp. SA101]
MSNSGELDEINETKKRSGRPREEVWEYFEEKGERIKGHCGGVCKFCGWEKRLAQPNDMREHLAFYCKEVPYETRKHYLEVIKNYSILRKGFQKTVFCHVVHWAIKNIWLSVERLQSLSKLHAYYVSNTKTELKFAAQNVNDDDIYNAMQNIFSDEVELDEIDEEELENFDEVENIEDETFDIDNGSNGQFDNNDNEMQIEIFFNLVDKELAELLKTQEVQVVIEPIIIDHGEKEFDIDDLLDQELVD